MEVPMVQILCAPTRRKYDAVTGSGHRFPIDRPLGDDCTIGPQEWSLTGLLLCTSSGIPASAKGQLARADVGARIAERPRTVGAFTRALVSAAGKWKPSARRVRIEAARKLDRKSNEAFAYLEGLEELDALDRAVVGDALERLPS